MRLPLTCLAALLAAPLALAQPKPLDCAASPEHRQFDFWLGSWQVRGPKGQLAGRNEIDRIEGGCALRERWQATSGVTGQSFNYYNPENGQWRQLWLDSGYSIIDISGGLDGDSMVLEGTITYLATAASHGFRGTWTPLPDGRVRQHFEQRDAEGAWQTWFDGFYTREDSGD